MKNFKKVMSMGLALVMAASLLSACGKDEQSNSPMTEDGRMIITIANSVAVNDNTLVEQYLEEKYNVEIKTYGYGASYYEKIATMFASKQIPDVMFINDISSWEPLASQGVLAPIDINTIKEAAPDHYKHINEKNEAMWQLGTKNGALYAIPKSMGTEYNTVMVWNKDWIENLGIKEIPDTIEEYDEAFELIKTGDPDGDGKDDTYAISGIGGNYYRQFDWLFGAYGVMPEMWTLDEDGKVINGTVSDKAKAGLAKLNEWYNKGYVNPEFLTDNQGTIATRWAQEGIAVYNTGIMNISPLHPHGRTMLEADPEVAARIAYGPLPAGPNGDRGDWLWGPLSNFVCFGAHMKDDVAKQKVILQILNDLNYDEETAVMAKYGPYGEGYTYYDEEVGKSSGIKVAEKYATDANAKAELGIGFFNLFSCGDWADINVMNAYLSPDYVKEQTEFANWGTQQDLLMRASLPSSLTYAATLQSLKTAAYSEFINGTRSLDDWDKFVEDYMNAGGAVLQKEAQEYYDTVINK